jgi:hypothetical protein
MAILVVILMVVLAYMVEAFFLMLGVGIMHLDWWQAMPSMGFGAAGLITFCLDTFLTLIIVGAVKIALDSK